MPLLLLVAWSTRHKQAQAISTKIQTTNSVQWRLNHSSVQGGSQTRQAFGRSCSCSCGDRARRIDTRSRRLCQCQEMSGHVLERRHKTHENIIYPRHTKVRCPKKTSSPNRNNATPVDTYYHVNFYRTTRVSERSDSNQNHQSLCLCCDINCALYLVVDLVKSASSKHAIV